MTEAEKFKTRPTLPPSTDERAHQRNELKAEVKRRAQDTKQPEDEVEKELLEELGRRGQFIVKTESMPGAPFYRVWQHGGHRVLSLNTAHRFYADVYSGPDSTPRLRAALELLLFVLGGCELDASMERRRFYHVERAEWSKELDVVLDLLGEHVVVEEEEPVEADSETSPAPEPVQ
jgi:hypothetical protein